jgi:myo-inositol catabolism protein IolC
MMNSGSDKALYLLPFDHRHSYVDGLFGFKPPLSAPQREEVIDSKQLIFEGFRQALAEGVPKQAAAILVDEEFGAHILSDAHRRGFVTALSVEQSGIDEFKFEYGDDFASHIEAFNPTFAKVLVRYNPEADNALNLRQANRLKQLSDYCQRSRRRFMFELLVPATPEQLKCVDGDADAFDRQIRPALMVKAIQALQAAGVEPDVWKIEGLDSRDDCERIVRMARCHGRDGVGCIVLGRGADEGKVQSWLATAASVEGFIGFAVGRTTFWDAVAGYRARALTRNEAVTQIARRLRERVDIFEQGRDGNARRPLSTKTATPLAENVNARS